MLTNYIKIALRNLSRNKSYAFINIAGLAVGLACCLLITMYVIHELSYERFHTNSDRLFRVVESYTGENETSKYATTYSALASVLKQEFSSIKHVSHVYPTSGLMIGPGNKQYQEESIVLADSAFFEMFSFPLIMGDPETVLDDPFTMVITESAALKYFGNENPVGQTLTLKDSRNSVDFEITGVAQDPPGNSHIQFEYLVSFESLKTMRPWEYEVWYHPPMYTYVELTSAASEKEIEEAFPGVYRRYRGEEADSYKLELQPITDIRLYSDLQNELNTTSDIIYVYLFSAIAVFILIIACINFMNLATARSMKRAREVGMRKTLGAQKGQLIGQFLCEAIMMALISLMLAIMMVEAVLPYFNDISGKILSTGMLYNWLTPLVLIGLVVIVGLISGSYPAFYLSSFRPVQVLKGALNKESSGSSRFRKGLVVFQFVISSGLILGTIVITRQLDYIQNEKLGFNKEQVLVIPVRETADQFNVKSLKQEIVRIPGVEHASAVSGLPGIGSGIHGFNVVPEENKSDTLNMLTLTADHSYVETLGLEIVAGRDFSEDFGTDETQAFVINRSAAYKLGWKDPIGKELTLRFYVTDLVEKKGQVIGMVEDFQYHSLHESIDPVLIQVYSSTFYHDYLAVRLGTGDVAKTLGELESKWASFSPDRPFEYFFLNETFDAMYRSEQRLSQVFNAFAVIAILIACLGLFGLASYSTELRIKEIGIRKVLGANVTDILGLLSKDFLKPVLIGFLLAVPLAMYLIRQWLNNFAEQIDVGFGMYFFAGIMAVAVGIIAVSYQTVRAALTNPINSLRSE